MSIKNFPSHTVRIARYQLLSALRDDWEFLEFIRANIKQAFSGVLLSGGEVPVEGENRFSIATWDPFFVFMSKGNYCTLRGPFGTLEILDNPLKVLDRFLASIDYDYPLVVPPFSGGAIGYFAYELKNSIERLPQTAADDRHLPEILLFWPSQIVVYDRLMREVHKLTLDCEGNEKTAYRPFPSTAEAAVGVSSQDRKTGVTSNFTHGEYLEAVRRVREYILAGDVYQVNLSQRLEFPFQGESFSFWKALFALNPAPFYAFIRGSDHEVLSTSMERFLYRRGTYIETRPIKGTRPRGRTPEEDAMFKDDLLKSRKDDAELSMIVDLLRNDLGRVCLPKTIRVKEHKRLESYQNVHHLVSIITGDLHPGTSYGDLLRATFPGGSITGCPKIRAMEIIDELEPCVRHVYTGAIGYLGSHGNMDLNVAIRTALIHKGKCFFSVGGGIVYDSNPEEEYQETLAKGRTLMEIVKCLQNES